uniref:Uncharacterized protein n=1 Tax=Poecilia latipinna TaxID=48699 RepID=A0A3B3UC51_9TELE
FENLPSILHWNSSSGKRITSTNSGKDDRVNGTDLLRRPKMWRILVCWNGTCWKLQGAASHWRTELLHHDDAVFMESPFQQCDDSYSVCLRVAPPGRPFRRLPATDSLLKGEVVFIFQPHSASL